MNEINLYGPATGGVADNAHGYAYGVSQQPPLETVSLNGMVEFDVGIPEVLSPLQQEEYKSEFTAWSIAHALSELDQSYQRFTASCLTVAKSFAAYISTGILPKDAKLILSSSCSTHEKFFAHLGKDSVENKSMSDHLRTLVNARNCLAHDSGVVTQMRLTNGDTMPITWVGTDVFQIGKDN